MASITCRDWPRPLFGKILTSSVGDLRVDVVGENPGKHLVLGADDIIGAGVIDADGLFVGRKRAARYGQRDRCDDDQVKEMHKGLRSRGRLHVFRSHE